MCSFVHFKLFNSYCMSLYGSQLWNYGNKLVMDSVYLSRALRLVEPLSRSFLAKETNCNVSITPPHILLVSYYTFSPLMICYHFYIKHCFSNCPNVLHLYATVF